MFNCVENALKYGGDSDVRIAVRACGGRVAITIRDEGPGIAESDRPRVFERFYRGDSTHGVPGSGLGLAIVKRVVENCRGTVAIESGSRRHGGHARSALGTGRFHEGAQHVAPP